MVFQLKQTSESPASLLKHTSLVSIPKVPHLLGQKWGSRISIFHRFSGDVNLLVHILRTAALELLAHFQLTKLETWCPLDSPLTSFTHNYPPGLIHLLYVPNKQCVQPLLRSSPSPSADPLSLTWITATATERSSNHLHGAIRKTFPKPSWDYVTHLHRTFNYPPLPSRCKTRLLVSLGFCPSLTLRSHFPHLNIPPPL